MFAVPREMAHQPEIGGIRCGVKPCTPFDDLLGFLFSHAETERATRAAGNARNVRAKTISLSVATIAGRSFALLQRLSKIPQL